jgi:hypothetical protein
VTFFDELGLKAAERLEASVGPWVALASYRRLLAADGPTRGVAALGMIRCAVALGDDDALVEALPAWREAKGVADGALGHVRVLLASKKPGFARELARAEVARKPRARAAYALAVATDASSPSGDRDAWETAAMAAAEAHAPDVLAASVGWFCARSFELAARGGTLRRARLTELAAMVDAAFVPAALRVHVARAGLASPRRFKRAAALSALDALARSANDRAREQALVAMLAHADGLGSRLDPVEIDRLRAALGRSADAATIARSELLFARLAGAAPDAAAEPSPLERAVREEPADAAAALDALGGALHPDAPLSAGEWRAALAAVDAKEPLLRAAGATLMIRALERTLGAPPFPWLECGRALVRAELDAVPFLEEAARWDEPGARAHLGDAQRALAYAALAHGERGAALAALLKARETFGPEAP